MHRFILESWALGVLTIVDVLIRQAMRCCMALSDDAPLSWLYATVGESRLAVFCLRKFILVIYARRVKKHSTSSTAVVLPIGNDPFGESQGIV